MSQLHRKLQNIHRPYNEILLHRNTHLVIRPLHRCSYRHSSWRAFPVIFIELHPPCTCYSASGCTPRRKLHVRWSFPFHGASCSRLADAPYGNYVSSQDTKIYNILYSFGRRVIDTLAHGVKISHSNYSSFFSGGKLVVVQKTCNNYNRR